MEKHIIENFEYYGCGFKVILHNIPQVTILGEECIDVDLEEIERRVLLGLLYAPFKLTGEHIKFIRVKLHMNASQFAKFLNKTHASILGWEKSGGNPTNMTNDTESILRLKVLEKVFGPEHLCKGFKKINTSTKRPQKTKILEFDPFSESEEILEG